jgi:RimJ/RimL family protein N-acetyltransferase
VRSDRLTLTPLRVSDALEMVEVLSDIGLYAYTGGGPPDLEELQSRYSYQVAGPPSGRQVWHNWILRLVESDVAIGFVQATVETGSADVAWLVAPEWQGRGLGTEAAAAMCAWLTERGVEEFTAHIHPSNEASARVASKVGLRPTGTIDSEGEVIWSATST